MDDLNFIEGSAEDFRKAVDLMYIHEKWFVSYSDYDAYKKACSNEGYHFIVCKDSKGTIIGCVSIAKLETDLAFIDNFFTVPEYRGRGIGKNAFNLALTEKIRESCNVGLHSDVRVTEYYSKKEGFGIIQTVIIEVYHLTRFSEGLKNVTAEDSFRLVDAKAAMNGVLCVDKLVWKKSRKEFLDAWLMRDVTALVVYYGEEAIGYGVIRKSCGSNNYILGPVYSKQEHAFLLLLSALLNNLPDDAKVEIRSPSSSSERLCRLLKGCGNLDKETKFITQFTKLLADYNYDPVYCITDTSVPI